MGIRDISSWPPPSGDCRIKSQRRGPIQIAGRMGLRSRSSAVYTLGLHGRRVGVGMSLVGNLEDLSLGDILQIISLSQKFGVRRSRLGLLRLAISIESIIDPTLVRVNITTQFFDRGFELGRELHRQGSQRLLVLLAL